MSSARARWVREMVETWNTGDVDTFLDSLDPDFTFTPDPSFPDSDILRGQKLRDWIHEWIDTWEGNELEAVEIEEREGGVLARCRWHLQASARSIEVPAADFTFAVIFDEDDHPRRLLAFFDPERAASALEGEAPA